MDREVKKGQIYRHFKGNLYEVILLAKHTETEETLVVYRPYDPDNVSENCFARPLDMFLGEVDHIKYPEVKEQYRFTLVGCEDAKEETEDTLLDAQLEKLLDAKTYGEKAQLLYALRERLTKDMIRTICITHDIELNSVEIPDQYEELKSYMLTMEKYESTRLR